MGKLRPFDIVAGVGGVVLLVSLFLSWYGLDVPQTTGEDFAPQPEFAIEVELPADTATGWQSFAVIDILLATIAVLAIAIPLVTAAAKGPAKPVAIAVLATALTPLAVVLVGFRLLDPPGPDDLFGFELGLRLGAWLGLAGALIAFVGSFGALKDESTPGAVAPDVPRRPAPPAIAA